MATIEISERLAKKLSELARRENVTTEDLLQAWVEEHTSTTSPDAPHQEEEPLNGLLMIAKAAEEAGLRSGYSDTARRSREILQNEIPEDMYRRMRGQDSDEKRDSG